MKRKPTIYVDTREQMPYRFTEDVVTLRVALPTGDYSLQSEDPQLVAVERKTLNDFIGSVIHARSRFLAEMERLSLFKHKCVVVEGSITQVINRDYDSATHPNSVIGAAIAIVIEYGIPVYFFENRQISELFVERFLSRIWRKEEEKNGILNNTRIDNHIRESFSPIPDEDDPPWLQR